MVSRQTLILLSALFLGGCSAINTIGDYINENPVFASMAVRQAVSRYIAAADTIEAESARANAVQSRINKTMVYIDGNPTTTVDSLMAVVDSSIDWAELIPADRMLVTDIIGLVEIELRKHESETPGIGDGTKLALRTLLKTAINAAEYYR